MLSSVLKSDQAALVNIAIMRIFTKLRSFMMLEKELVTRINRLESDTTEVFKVVFEKLDGLDEQLPYQRKNRTKIGLNNKDQLSQFDNGLFSFGVVLKALKELSPRMTPTVADFNLFSFLKAIVTANNTTLFTYFYDKLMYLH